jgi:hypothetical protein
MLEPPLEPPDDEAPPPPPSSPLRSKAGAGGAFELQLEAAADIARIAALERTGRHRRPKRSSIE